VKWHQCSVALPWVALLLAGCWYQEARGSHDRYCGGLPSPKQVGGVAAAERSEAEGVSCQVDTVPEEDVKTKEGRCLGLLLCNSAFLCVSGRGQVVQSQLSLLPSSLVIYQQESHLKVCDCQTS